MVDHEIVIIGAGFAGLGMAIRLKRAGFDDFLIFEKEAEVGGTWMVNSYPGCACDVPSHLYSFSFEPNPDWGRMFSPQEEIWEYLRRCTDKYDLRRSIRFNTEVASCRYDEAEGCWRVKTAGRETTCRFVVAAFGPLSRPARPDLPGLADFRGEVFHSQQWNHDFDLTGKSVVVVGTGASAIQFVPRIAPKVGHLSLFQRTPPWVISKPDRPIRQFEQRLFRRLPIFQQLYRLWIYMVLESRVPFFVRLPWVLKLMGRQAHDHIAAQVADPELRRKLTPDYTIGCKRILLSDEYYPALARDNVELVTAGIQTFEERGAVDGEGRLHEADLVILGTGFEAADPVSQGFLVGREGRDILDAWTEGPEAYLGTSVAGFPNLFVLAGPNTGLGHTSVVYMIESQLQYIMSALRQMRQQGIGSVDVRPEVQKAYNERLQKKMAKTVWIRGGCTSWYKNEAGKNVTLWPGSTLTFRRLTRHFALRDYLFRQQGG